MSRRTERVGNMIRNIIGELLLSKIADPRIDPAKTSVTRVDVAEDLLAAKVFVSVIGSEAEQRRALRGLSSASGHIQELMVRQMTLRNTPILQFVLDKNFKQGLRTLQLIQQAMDEIEQRQQQRDAQAPPAEDANLQSKQ